MLCNVKLSPFGEVTPPYLHERLNGAGVYGSWLQLAVEAPPGGTLSPICRSPGCVNYPSQQRPPRTPALLGCFIDTLIDRVPGSFQAENSPRGIARLRCAYRC